jgi:hypothetical protein
MAVVETGDEVRALLLGGGDFAGRNEAAPQQPLLVFAVEQKDAQDQILRLADEKADLRLGGAIGGGQALPLDAVLPNIFQRFAQAGQQGLAGSMDLIEHGGLTLAQSLRFTLGQRKQFAADGLVGAEVGEHLGECVHGLAR